MNTQIEWDFKQYIKKGLFIHFYQNNARNPVQLR